MVITERECVGSYLGHPIFKVSKLKVFPCDNSLKNTPAEQVCLLPLHLFPFSFISTSLELIIVVPSLAEENRYGIFYTA